jgi:MFS family permease
MPASRLITKPFVTVTAVTAAFFVYVGMLVPILPTYIEDDLGGGDLAVGMSTAIFALAAIAARPWIARLIDRWGRRAVIQGGALLAAVSGFGLVLVDALGPLLALRTVGGVGEAALFVSAATLVADLAPPERRAEAASYFSVAVFGGLGIGPVLGDVVVGDGRYHLAFGVAAAFTVLAAVLAAGVPTRIVGPHTDPDADVLDEAVPATRRTFLHPAALGPGLVLAAGIGAFAVFSSFVPDHARDIGLSGAGGLFAVYSVVCLVLRLTGARLPERLGARRSVTIALSATGSSLALLAAVPQPAALWGAAVLIGIGQAFLYPSLMALTVNRVSERERAVALGSFTMFFDIGTMAGGLALGLVAQQFGKRSAFAGGVALAAVGMWLLWTRVTGARAEARPVEPTPGAVAFAPAGGD